MSHGQSSLFSYTYKNKIVRVAAFFIDIIGYGIFFWAKKPIKKGGIKKILVSRTDQIGDNFLATSFVEEIKKIFPDAAIDIMTGERTKTIWENNPCINEIIVFNNPRLKPAVGKISAKQLLSLSKKLRGEKYDLFIDPRGEPLTALIGFLARVPQRAGFAAHEVLGFLYTARAIYRERKNEWLKYNDLLALFDYAGKLTLPKIYPSEQEKNKVNEIIKNEFGGKKIIALHLNSGAKYKIWPTENFARLAEKIHKKYPDAAFVVLGGRGEEPYCEKFQSKIDFPTANLIGKLSLKESYEFLSRVSLFIGNDSSLAHFAGSQNIPTVDLINTAIGGAERGRPPGEKVYILEGNDPKHHCPTGNCYPCPNMEATKISDVLNIVWKILK